MVFDVQVGGLHGTPAAGAPVDDGAFVELGAAAGAGGAHHAPAPVGVAEGLMQ